MKIFLVIKTEYSCDCYNSAFPTIHGVFKSRKEAKNAVADVEAEYRKHFTADSDEEMVEQKVKEYMGELSIVQASVGKLYAVALGEKK